MPRSKQLKIVGAVRVYGRAFRVGKDGSAALTEYLDTLTPEQRRNAEAHLRQTGAVEGLEEDEDQPIVDATKLASAAGEIKDETQGQGNTDSSIPPELRPPPAPLSPAEQENEANAEARASGTKKRGG